ncbi:hypothetical protein B7494_g8113 [Chlorociboria aeruginascens]|nr:hypothetical protein B7494_g8113 [Chlorociboria aeruginascens]
MEGAATATLAMIGRDLPFLPTKSPRFKVRSARNPRVIPTSDPAVSPITTNTVNHILKFLQVSRSLYSYPTSNNKIHDASDFTGLLGNATVVLNNPPGVDYQATLPAKSFFNPSDPRGNVKGWVSASANPDGIGVDIKVSFSNFPTSGGPFLYHIHAAPVSADGNCTNTLGHLDPFIRGETPACDSELPQTCQVGDLSGKYGTIKSDPFTTSYTDYFASTEEGLGSFFGNRSITLHYANTTRLTCANFTLQPATTASNSSGTGSATGTASSKPLQYTGRRIGFNVLDGRSFEFKGLQIYEDIKISILFQLYYIPLPNTPDLLIPKIITTSNIPVRPRDDPVSLPPPDTKKRPYIGHLKAFGCLAYAHILKKKRYKFEPNVLKTIFVGYMHTTRQYKLYDPIKKRIIVATKPKFLEDKRLEWDWAAPNNSEGSEDEIVPFDPMGPVGAANDLENSVDEVPVKDPNESEAEDTIIMDTGDRQSVIADD